MTTPERLKHRQRLLELFGAIILVVGLISVGQGIYVSHQTQLQKQCLVRQVTDLTASLTVRGELAQEDSNATRTVILSVAQAATQAQVRDALNAYLSTQEKIAKDRANHPVPPFPTGTCP